MICCQEKIKFVATLRLCGVCNQIGTSHSARKFGSHRLAKNFVVWNRSVPHGIKIATFRDDGEVEGVFESATVRTRDTAFPVFGRAEEELQDFGESVRARLKDQVLLSVA